MGSEKLTKHQVETLEIIKKAGGVYTTVPLENRLWFIPAGYTKRVDCGEGITMVVLTEEGKRAIDNYLTSELPLWRVSQ